MQMNYPQNQSTNAPTSGQPQKQKHEIPSIDGSTTPQQPTTSKKSSGFVFDLRLNQMLRQVHALHKEHNQQPQSTQYNKKKPAIQPKGQADYPRSKPF